MCVCVCVCVCVCLPTALHKQDARKGLFLSGI